MEEKLNNFWEKVKSFFANMSKTTKVVLAIVLAMILIIFLARWVVIQTRPYEVVFYDLTDADLQQITAYMLDNNVEGYRIEGNTILMPDGEADPLRAAIYMLGLPNSGTAYETYNSMVGSMSTDSDKAQAVQYDREMSLASTIRNITGIHDAVVMLTPGENRSYVLDSTNMVNATAHVHVELTGTQPLSSEVVNAIRLAVSHGWQDLDPSDVAISDNLGNSYSDSSSSVTAIGEASYLKLEIQEYVNNQIRSELMSGLAAIYGISGIRISVATEVDIDRKISTSTEYPMPEYAIDPNDPNDGAGIIGSQVWSGAYYGQDGVYIGGLVGATPNSDIPMYPTDADGDGELDWQGYTSGQTDYKVPEVNTQSEQLAGVVTDVRIGVAIDTDGTNAEALDNEALLHYVSVLSGVGTEIADEKISIIYGSFDESFAIPEEEEGIQAWVWFAIIAGLALFVIIVITIIVLLRKKKREEEEAAEAAAEEERRLEAERAAAEIAALAPVDGADIMDVNTEKSMELRKDLRTFVGNNPEIAASLLRNLMKGGEPPDAT